MHTPLRSKARSVKIASRRDTESVSPMRLCPSTSIGMTWKHRWESLSSFKIHTDDASVVAKIANYWWDDLPKAKHYPENPLIFSARAYWYHPECIPLHRAQISFSETLSSQEDFIARLIVLSMFLLSLRLHRVDKTLPRRLGALPMSFMLGRPLADLSFPPQAHSASVRPFASLRLHGDPIIIHRN